MFTDQSCYCFQSLSVIVQFASAIQFMHRGQCVAMLLPCLPVINPLDIFRKMGNWKSYLANKDESPAKKQKVLTLEVKSNQLYSGPSVFECNSFPKTEFWNAGKPRHPQPTAGPQDLALSRSPVACSTSNFVGVFENRSISFWVYGVHKQKYSSTATFKNRGITVIQIRKKKLKLPILADNMILYEKIY